MSVMKVLQNANLADYKHQQVNDCLFNSVTLISIPGNGNIDTLMHSAFISKNDKPISNSQFSESKKIDMNSEPPRIIKNISNKSKKYKDAYNNTKICFDEKELMYYQNKGEEIEINDAISLQNDRRTFQGLERQYININTEDNTFMLNNNEIRSQNSNLINANDDSEMVLYSHDYKYHQEDGENTTMWQKTHMCKHSHFVRGIINPNYPGFQHLAHTLSEHFISHTCSDSCDTDTSECEIELNDIYVDSDPKEYHQYSNELDNNNYINSHNNDEMKNDELNIKKSKSFEHKILKSADSDLITINEENLSCSTPDILIKTHGIPDTNHKTTDRPDLLQNVNLTLTSLTNFKPLNDKKILSKNKSGCKDNTKISPIISKNVHITDHINAEHRTVCGITPVDIIGDFEQEVQREFGLLVSGYSRLADGCNEENMEFITKKLQITDATLSNGTENIITNKCLRTNDKKKVKKENVEKSSDNNEDRLLSSNISSYDPMIPIYIEKIPTYRKHSFDERQLPPVGIDYKCSQLAKARSSRMSLNSEKHLKKINSKVCRNNSKSPSTNNQFKIKTTNSTDLKNVDYWNRELNEVLQYQQLLSEDKEKILSKSRYSKIAFWAKHLRNSVNETDSNGLCDSLSKYNHCVANNNNESSTNRFDHAMRSSTEVKINYERKRRYDRDEIRRRLAMGIDDDYINQLVQTNVCSSSQTPLKKFIPLTLNTKNEISSDNDSHSSDSETCPQLSKVTQSHIINCNAEGEPGHLQLNTPLSITIRNKKKISLLPLGDNNECDFFTKQSRLQIEARMGLAQAKDMAHMHMKIERQKQRSSPITDVIRGSLIKVGVQMTSEKRRVSRQMLTDMNMAQLQIIVNDLHTHIEDLNESLVQYLTGRDELHIGQDSMLVDIKDLTRYLSAKEQSFIEDKEPHIYN